MPTVSELVTRGKLLANQTLLAWKWEAGSKCLRNRGSGKPSTGVLSSGRNSSPEVPIPTLYLWEVKGSKSWCPTCSCHPPWRPAPQKTPRWMHRRHPQTYRKEVQPASLHPLKAVATHCCCSRDNMPSSKRNCSSVQEGWRNGRWGDGGLHPRFPDTGDFLDQTSQTLDHAPRNTPLTSYWAMLQQQSLVTMELISLIYKHVTRAFLMELTTAHQKSIALFIQTLQCHTGSSSCHLHIWSKWQEPLVEANHRNNLSLGDFPFFI